jgi:hypothetical protein
MVFTRCGVCDPTLLGAPREHLRAGAREERVLRVEKVDEVAVLRRERDVRSASKMRVSQCIPVEIQL